MSQYKSYPAYKDSGVKWLGQLPLQWEVKRIKHTAYLKGRVGWKGLTSEEYLDQGYAYLVTGTDFTSKFIDWSNCHCVTQERYEDDPFIQLRNGDLLMTKDGTIGKLALVSGLDKEACLNSGIFLVRPEKSYTTQFLYWVLSAKLFSDFCYLFNSGATILHLYKNVFENFALPIPNYSEQDRITSYLENETARIDALVGKKTSFIELLREKRQALINRAITKGLDPNVTMRDSGLEWLGQVPENWEVKPIKYLTSHIGSGKTPSGGATVYQDDGVIFLRSQNIYDDGLRLDDVAYISEEIDCGMRGSRVQVGDVLLNITGASIGRTCNISKNIGPANVNQHVCIIRAHDSDISEWIAECFLSDMIKEQIKIVQNGAGREGLNFEQIGNMIITLPMATEREYINSWLKAQRGRIDTLICKTEQSIDLLKERRTALITAAVTGQIDLREVAQ